MLELSTALGRLLSDAGLRRAFRADAKAALAGFDLREADRQALLELSPDDIDYQAAILLRKRLSAVQRLLPETCAKLGEACWLRFQDFAQTYWPPAEEAELQDARAFADYLGAAANRAELNRLRFATSRRRLAVHGLLTGGIPRMQIFWRRRGAWREILLRLGV